jgi:hypothetical protein
LILDDTNFFIENAYSQNYFAPNQIISKKERPKWRFVVKRLYNDLSLAARIDDDLPLAAQLLEKLYILLCYSCDYTLFNAYDPFQSIGITQKEFFHRILSLKYRYENSTDFVRNALLLLINNSLNMIMPFQILKRIIGKRIPK